MECLAAGVALFAIGALLYTYAIYPALLMMLAPLREPRKLSATCYTVDDPLPSVSLILPFHNEERWVVRKLTNALALDYPSDRFEIVAISDGSTDGTNRELARFKDRVTTVIYEPRQGKPTALNRGVEASTGKILIFSDANVLLECDAVRKIARRYADPSIGGVSGRVVLVAEKDGEPLGEGLYMRYERLLYGLDSRVHTMVGADGALCSIRRTLYRTLPMDAITDDLHLALDVLAQDYRMVYEPHANGTELVAPDVRAEFTRKSRMVAGGYQTLWRFHRLLNPLANPMVAFQLVSHKLCRWLVPLFLAATMTASLLAMHDNAAWRMLVLLQLTFYASALTGWLSASIRRYAVVYVPYYFCAVNAAAAVGLWRFLMGRQAIVWQKVSR